MENNNNQINNNNQQNNNSSKVTNKGKLVVSYLIPIVGIAYLISDKTADASSRMHYKRITTLFLCYLAYTIASQIIPFLEIASMLVYIAYIGTLIFCGIKAYNGQDVTVAGIDDIANSLFKN